MEAEKFHDLLSAGWRSKEAGGGIQPESKGLKTREGDGAYPSPRAEEGEILRFSSEMRKKGRFFCLPLLFCSGPQWFG